MMLVVMVWVMVSSPWYVMCGGMRHHCVGVSHRSHAGGTVGRHADSWYV